jgi:hypothetical protein
MIPSDQWVHFIIDADPTLSTASVTVNGTKVTVTGGSVAGTKTETEIFIGLLGYNSPAPAFEAYYDNVLVTEVP